MSFALPTQRSPEVQGPPDWVTSADSWEGLPETTRQVARRSPISPWARVCSLGLSQGQGDFAASLHPEANPAQQAAKCRRKLGSGTHLTRAHIPGRTLREAGNTELPGGNGSGPRNLSHHPGWLVHHHQSFICAPLGEGSCMCWGCPVINLTPESSRLSSTQTPGDSFATLGLSGPSRPPRVRLTWACGTYPSSASACQHHLSLLPAQGRAQQILHSGGSESQTGHHEAQGCPQCPVSILTS